MKSAYLNSAGNRSSFSMVKLNRKRRTTKTSEGAQKECMYDDTGHVGSKAISK